MSLCVARQAMWCLGAKKNGGIVNHVLTEYLDGRAGLELHRMTCFERHDVLL